MNIEDEFAGYLIRRIVAGDLNEPIEDEMASVERIDLNKYKITKPVLFSLGGNMTTNNHAAVGIATIAGISAGIENQADMISMVYSKDEINDWDKIVSKLFAPLFLDASGRRLPLKVALKKARRVTFFCHCYGAEALDRINACVIQLLKNQRYSDDEIKMILRQFVAITYGANYKNYYNTMFEVKSIEDELFASWYNNELFDYLGTHPEESDEMEIEGHLVLGGGKFVKKENGYNLYVQEVASKNSERKQPNHSIRVIARMHEITKQILAEGVSATDEKVINWETDPAISSERGEVSSKIVAYVVARTVLNSIKNIRKYTPFDLDEIVEECQSFIDEYNKSAEGIAFKKELLEKYKKKPIKQIIKELGYSEKELLSDIKMLYSEILTNPKYKYSLDLTGSLYGAFDRNFTPKSNQLGDREIAPYMLYSFNSVAMADYLLISPSGETFVFEKDTEIKTALNLKFRKPESLKGAIVVAIRRNKDKREFHIYDSLGSRDDFEFENLEDIVKEWQEMYNSTLTFALTKYQKQAIQNIARSLCVKPEDIIFLKDTTSTTKPE